MPFLHEGLQLSVVIHFILVTIGYHGLLPCLRENTLLNFEFKNEATRTNLQVNKRILKWWPFWNEVYVSLG